MRGTVESRKVRMGVERRDVVVRLRFMVVMSWSPTTRSRSMSEARVKETLLGVNRSASYPPKVRLARAPQVPFPVAQSAL